jgi:hypothetical protein
MCISDMETFEQLNKNTFERVFMPLNIGDPIKLGITRSPSSWNDLVKTIKKRNHGSNINHKNGEL